jgi:hypothetical protein
MSFYSLHSSHRHWQYAMPLNRPLRAFLKLVAIRSLTGFQRVYLTFYEFFSQVCPLTSFSLTPNYLGQYQSGTGQGRSFATLVN